MSRLYTVSLLSCVQTVIGASQPIVVFTQQPQQAYYSVPQVDSVMAAGVPGEQISICTHSES